jgi:hypothetical protein
LRRKSVARSFRVTAVTGRLPRMAVCRLFNGTQGAIEQAQFPSSLQSVDTDPFQKLAGPLKLGPAMTTPAP